MYKQKIEEQLKSAVLELGFVVSDIVLSISENSQFGDYTSNIALQLSNQKHQNSYHSPREVANAVLEKFGHPDYLERVEVAGPGFLNFFIKKEKLAEELKEILKKDSEFGKNNLGQNQKVQVEFISANPTGPLTLANGRGGAIGNALANVLTFSGFAVDKEYYVNDTGNQIRMLGESVLAALGKLAKSEDHYQGEYIKDLADRFKDDSEIDPQRLGHKLADYFLEDEIKPIILKLGINFNDFFSERSLYPDKIEAAVKILKEKKLSFEKDGAIWFKSTQFGDEKDRVLMTSEGERGRAEPTYFLADIAHYLMVFSKGYNLRINILGADHHSYAVRLQAALQALGYGNESKIIIFQFVRLFKEGKEIRMSKRTGNIITMDELLEEISPDVAKFFFLMHSPNTLIDFNLDLAKEQSNKNPVYYVQYAHARMSSILEKAGKVADEADLTLLVQEAESELIKKLLSFPDLVLEIAQDFQVQKLTTYAIEIADLTNKFYESSSVLYASDEKLKQARLKLVQASKLILNNTLHLIGVSAPEKM